jgi:TetR/AcrR family transcriptional regulator
MSKKSTRERLFSAACKVFADCGYQGASVESIVQKARTTKPSLYYYFKSKEDLFRSLVDYGHDERFRIMKEVCQREAHLKDQLIGILEEFFKFARAHSELTRLCFTIAFAAEREIPIRSECFKKAERNFEYLHSLFAKGIKEGVFSKRYDGRLLAAAFHGQILFFTISYILRGEPRANRRTAEQIIELFFEGAARLKRRNEQS